MHNDVTLETVSASLFQQSLKIKENLIRQAFHDKFKLELTDEQIEKITITTHGQTGAENYSYNGDVFLKIYPFRCGLDLSDSNLLYVTSTFEYKLM